jgi:hypothetical protein
MTTSSSDRCTRISPSAILDDRLDGKDLEWARDHLRRCESCRERVEDFREMLLRVGRLPKATVGATAMDEAYTRSVPERIREEAGVRSYEISPDTSRLVPALGSALHPDAASIPDLMTELEREIFRDEPSHPTQLESMPDPIYPTMTPAVEEDAKIVDDSREPAVEPEVPIEDVPPPSWREVPVDSHQVPEHPPVVPAQPASDQTDWDRLLERIANAPDPEPSIDAEPAFPKRDWVPTVRPEPAVEEPEVPAEPPRNVIYDQEPALGFEPEPVVSAAEPVAKRPRSDTVMRLAVGFGAAACVLLAALLYEGGYLFKSHATASLSPTASVKASIRPSPSLRATAAPTPAPTPKPSATTANVLFTLGNGVPGETIFRIREGTAVAGFTRLVFDMHGNGLPSVVITQNDPSHVEVMFMNTALGNVAVNGLRSYQISTVEPGVQTGPNSSFVIDLARPVKLTAFTLPASGSYAWRLVVDLHTI